MVVCCMVLFRCADLFKDDAVLLKPPVPVKLNTPQKIFATGAVLTWEKSADNNFSAYKLFYDTLPGVDESSKLAVTILYKDSTAFTLKDLWENSTYYARVFTYTSDNLGGSNELAFTTRECTCDVFTGVKEGGMVRIPSGCFTGKDGSMGTISYDYFMDTTEVTEAEWYQIMHDSVVASQKPKTKASWFEMILFCNKKSNKINNDTCYSYSFLGIDTTNNTLVEIRNLKCEFSKNGFRLPTEDEWEYAYRAGGWEEYFWGKDGKTLMEYPYTTNYPSTADDTLEVGKYAWWAINSSGELQEVGQKLPNRWGLYDMAGNCAELVWDITTPKRITTRFDYSGPMIGPQSDSWRIMRGGTYGGFCRFMTAWWRLWTMTPSDNSNGDVGFRTVRTAK